MNDNNDNKENETEVENNLSMEKKSRSNSNTKQREEVDPRNRLNDLSNKEWMISTKSVWKSETINDNIDILGEDEWQAFSEWLIEIKGVETAEKILDQILPSVIYSRPPSRDKLKSQHPATFAETDIERLLRFFTKQDQRVLDPFVGSGSTLIACKATNRNGVGIELVPRWAEIARKRVSGDDLPLFRNIEIEEGYPQQIIDGDAREIMCTLGDETFDFIVTSPPYWKILHKDKDHKVIRERASKGLDTRYSELENDLGNIGSYEDFLRELKKVFAECYRVLKDGKYMCVIVSDFRDKGKFIPFHSNVSESIEKCNFALQGITILVQDNKNLYPYGIPYSFVSNVCHQNILIFRKKTN